MFAQHLVKETALRYPMHQIIYLSDEPLRNQFPFNVRYQRIRHPGYRRSLLHIVYLLSNEPEMTMLVVDDLQTLFCYPDNGEEIVELLHHAARKHHILIILLLKVRMCTDSSYILSNSALTRLMQYADKVILL